jgi:hypothetical protein
MNVRKNIRDNLGNQFMEHYEKDSIQAKRFLYKPELQMSKAGDFEF